jgi:hypothetical protein
VTRAARSTWGLVSENHKNHTYDARTVVGTDGPRLCSSAAVIEAGGDMGALLAAVAMDIEEARRTRFTLVEVMESLAYSQI